MFPRAECALECNGGVLLSYNMTNLHLASAGSQSCLLGSFAMRRRNSMSRLCRPFDERLVWNCGCCPHGIVRSFCRSGRWNPKRSLFLCVFRQMLHNREAGRGPRKLLGSAITRELLFGAQNSAIQRRLGNCSGEAGLLRTSSPPLWARP